MKIPEQVIDEIISKVNIVDYIGKFVDLEKRGTNFFGCCPFHQEDTPSFSVSETKEIFHCFGCHEGGNVLQFVMKHENLSFLPAISKLAEIANVNIEAYGTISNERVDNQRTLYETTYSDVSKLYEYLLTTEIGTQAMMDLQSRNISENAVQQFKIGYAPSKSVVESHLKSVDKEILLQFELIRVQENRTYDFFRNRITFPILNEDGQVIAFSSRKMSTDTNEASPKYINTSETPYFHKNAVLYNYFHAKKHVKKTGVLYIFEGVTDVISAYQAGIENCVAVLGTALTQNHIRAIKKLNCKVVLCFDSDNAGVNATFKSGELLITNQIPTLVISLQPGIDPDLYFKSHDANDFKMMTNTADDYIIYKAKILLNQYIVTQLDDQKKYISDMMSSLQNYTSSQEQDFFISKISEISNIQPTYFNTRKLIVKSQTTGNMKANLISDEIVIIRHLLVSKFAFEQFKDKQLFFITKDFQKIFMCISEYRFYYGEVDEINDSDFYEFINKQKLSNHIETLDKITQQKIIIAQSNKLIVALLGAYENKLLQFKIKEIKRLKPDNIADIQNLVALKRQIIKK